MSNVDGNGEPSQRERILKVAARLFAERGYHAVGIAELGEAGAAGARRALSPHQEQGGFAL